MFIIINGQMVCLKHNRIVQIQRLTEMERYVAARRYGAKDYIAAGLVKGLFYTPVKGI